MGARLAALLLLALLPTLAALSGRAGPAEDGPRDRVLAIDWLEGRWRGTFDGLPFEAVYTSAEGGEVLGASKHLRDGRVAVFELERFHVEDGAAVVTPFPFGRRSDSFRLTELDREARRARFECPEHDFPQVLEYHRVSDDRLVIHLAGEQGGEERELVAELRRAR